MKHVRLHGSKSMVFTWDEDAFAIKMYSSCCSGRIIGVSATDSIVVLPVSGLSLIHI